MTVFKTFLKVVNANKTLLIVYTVILLVIASFSMQATNGNTNFTNSKPSVVIINNDKDNSFTKSLVKYIKKNSEVKKINKDEIEDALFYRDISYIITIPENFGTDFINKTYPKIEIKSAGDASASIEELLINKYLNTANIYLNVYTNETDIIKNTESTLNSSVKVKVDAKLETNELRNLGTFYSFMVYTLIAGCVFTICMVISSFKNINIMKRTEISSYSYKKINRQLLLSNGLFVLCIWILYIIASFFVVGDIIFSPHGLITIFNSFIFLINCLTLAFLIATITTNKNALSGLINVLALGTAFLCGVFVPQDMLPNAVLKVAHILPGYYYVKNNEIIITLEKINLDTIKSVINNMIIILIFSVIYLVLITIISNKKRRIS